MHSRSFRPSSADRQTLRNEIIIAAGDVEYFADAYNRAMNQKSTEPGELEYLREQLFAAKAELFEITQQLKRIR